MLKVLPSLPAAPQSQRIALSPQDPPRAPSSSTLPERSLTGLGLRVEVDQPPNGEYRTGDVVRGRVVVEDQLEDGEGRQVRVASLLLEVYCEARAFGSLLIPGRSIKSASLSKRRVALASVHRSLTRAVS